MPALARQGCGHLERRLPGQATAVSMPATASTGSVSVPVLSNTTWVAGECLDCVGPHHEHSASREHGEGAGDRRRHGKREGTGTGHDQHRQRRRECTRRIDEAPCGDRHRGQRQHARTKARSGALSRASETRPLGLRARDERGDACKCRVLANPIARSSAGPSSTTLPAISRSPRLRLTVADSPVSSAWSTRQCELSRTPSAGTTPPSLTCTRSPTASSCTPRARARRRGSDAARTVARGGRARRSGRRCWCRALISRWRPASRKNTNIDTESKYT